MPGVRGIMTTMDYDLARLTQLGRKHQRLRAELEALRPELAEEIRAAHDAGRAQVDIVKASGYTRDQVRQICLPPERRRVRTVTR
jgi:septal ring factor EnvC (AmiA/AmiB activator)